MWDTSHLTCEPHQVVITHVDFDWKIFLRPVQATDKTRWIKLYSARKNGKQGIKDFGSSWSKCATAVTIFKRLVLTVGKLKSRLLVLLARSRSCLWFDIGQLLWFCSTYKSRWKNQWNITQFWGFLSSHTSLPLLSRWGNWSRERRAEWHWRTIKIWHLQR